MSDFKSLDDEPIDAFGIPGFLGHPAGAIKRKIEEMGFREAIWIKEPTRESDLHVFFESFVEIEDAHELTISIQTCGNFILYVDDEIKVRGPIRFACNLAEYYSEDFSFSKGTHKISVLAHGEFLKTRIMAPLPNFIWVRANQRDKLIPLVWRAREVTEYSATGLRISPLLGWVEWTDKPLAPRIAEKMENSENWHDTERVNGLLEVTGPITKSDLKIPRLPLITPTCIGTGKYRDTFTGYKYDDLSVQYLLADLNPDERDDLDGVWSSFDLGRIRIGYFNVTIKCEEESEVFIAYAERLTPFGMPSPVVALSAGSTRFIQHFSVGPGISVIEPMQSMGAKYIQVRVRGKKKIEISNPIFIERDFLGEPTGSLNSPDPLLNKIWQVGIETLRASAEDSLVDSVRERGEWVGDAVAAALNVLVVGWGDYTLVKRALLHAAAAAREDGLVAGCGPGELIYLGTYASMWITACLEVATQEGNLEILLEFEESARANINALDKMVNPDGSHCLPWPFIDWGYAPAEGEPDLAVLSHYSKAIHSWIKWQRLIGKAEEVSVWRKKVNHLDWLIRENLSHSQGKYHCYSLAANTGIIEPIESVEVIKQQLDAGFPNKLTADRLRNPLSIKPGMVTPYFTNYSMPNLIRAGLSTEVIFYWKKYWGWMLAKEATTWWEVFDDRWSHCHYWSASPTWQLSRFGLGLHAQLDEDGSRVILQVHDFGLEKLEGKTHLPIAGLVSVKWEHKGQDLLSYEIINRNSFVLDIAGEKREVLPGKHIFLLKRSVKENTFY